MWVNCAPNFCSSSVVKAMRARCATYLMSKSEGMRLRRRSRLVELAIDQLLDRPEGFVTILALAGNHEFGPRTGGQHHQAHDALAVNLFAVLFNHDFAGKAIGHL